MSRDAFSAFQHDRNAWKNEFHLETPIVPTNSLIYLINENRQFYKRQKIEFGRRFRV